MQIIKAGRCIDIGREGEHHARQVRFPISHWQSLYGEGAAELIYQRPGDSSPYPVAVEQRDGLVLWTVTSTDTARPGQGSAELRYYVGETLAKSEQYAIRVGDAMGAPEAIPDPPGQSWLDQAVQASAESKLNAAAAQEAREGSETAEKNAKASETAAAQSETNAKASEQAVAELAEQLPAAIAAGVQIIGEAAAQETQTAVKAIQTEGAAQTAAAKAEADRAAEQAGDAEQSAQKAKDSETAAAQSAKKAEEVVNNAAWVAAEVNEAGHLILTQSKNFNGASFAIDESGNLEVTYE